MGLRLSISWCGYADAIAGRLLLQKRHGLNLKGRKAVDA